MLISYDTHLYVERFQTICIYDDDDDDDDDGIMKVMMMMMGL